MRQYRPRITDGSSASMNGECDRPMAPQLRRLRQHQLSIWWSRRSSAMRLAGDPGVRPLWRLGLRCKSVFAPSRMMWTNSSSACDCGMNSGRWHALEILSVRPPKDGHRRACRLIRAFRSSSAILAHLIANPVHIVAGLAVREPRFNVIEPARI